MGEHLQSVVNRMGLNLLARTKQISVYLLSAVLVASGFTVPAQASTSGVFRVDNYAPGSASYSFANYFWRGYAFSLEAPITLTHLIGGGRCTTGVVVFEAQLETVNGNPRPRLKSMATPEVKITDNGQTDPRNVVRPVALPSSVTLPDVDISNNKITYVLAQRGGVDGTSTSCHARTSQLDISILRSSTTFLFDTWYPLETEVPQGVFRFGSGNAPDLMVSGSGTLAESSLESTIPILGFEYELTGVELPTVETSDSPLAGSLSSTGNGQTTVTIEYGTAVDNPSNPTSFGAGSLVTPGAVFAADAAMPAQITSSLVGLSAGTTYYYQARASNARGVVRGTIKSFTTAAAPLAPTIASISGQNGSLLINVTPPTGDPISNYQYQLNGGAWVTRQPASSSNELTISGLVNGTSYSVKVRAVRDGLIGAESIAVSGSPSLSPASITLSAAAGTISGAQVSVTSNSPATRSYSVVGPNTALGCQVSSSGLVTADTAGTCRIEVAIAANSDFSANSDQILVTLAKSTATLSLPTSSDALTVYQADGSTRLASFTVDPNDSNLLSVELQIGETLGIPFVSPNQAAIFGFSSNDRCTAVRNPANASQALFAQTASGGDGAGVYYLRANQLGACATGDDAGGFSLKLDPRAYDAAGESQKVFVTVVPGQQAPLAVTGATSATVGQTVVLSASGGSSTGARSYQVTSGECTIETIDFTLFGESYPALNTARLTSAEAGSCVVTATQAGDERFASVTSANLTITFAKQNQQLRFTSMIPTEPNVGSTYLPVAVATSGLPVSYAASGTCSMAAQTNIVTFSGAGACTISATQSGDTGFSAAVTRTQVIQVGQRNQTITMGSIADRGFTSPPFRITAATTEPSLSVALTTVDAGICTVDSFGLVSITGVGICTINADQAGVAGTVAAAPRVIRTFEIAPARPAAPRISAVSSTVGSLTATVTAPSMTGGSAITHYEMQVFGTGASEGQLIATNTSCQAVAPGSLQTCSVSGLANATSYSVRMRAVNAAGVSALSAAWSPATTLVNPFAAREFTARANSPLTVTWEAPNSLGGETFVRYDLFIKLSTDANFPNTPDHSENCAGAAVACDASHTFTGLTSGEGYDILIFVVTAEGGYPDSSYTNLISYTAPVAPDSVENLTLTPSGNDLVITWEYPADDGGSSVTQYLVLIDGEPVQGCDPVSIRICVVDMADVKSFNVTVIPVSTVGQGLTAVASYQVPQAGGAPVYSGPLVSSVSNRSPMPGERVVISGQRLNLVTGASVGGKSISLTPVAGGALAFVFPDGLAAGTLDLVLRSSAGQLTVQGLFTVREGSTTDAGSGRNQPGTTPTVWLREYRPGQFKVYAFGLVGAGKLQIKVQGDEVAWVSAESVSDSRLRQLASGEPYFVRTVSASDPSQISVVVSGETIQLQESPS
jgi:hypothetical protein